MKKYFLYIAVFVAQAFISSVYAQNQPDIEYRDVYREYIPQRELSEFLTKVSVGDTLYVSSSYCVAEYVLPDTIWKKRVKKPKENKHYVLQYIWNGVPTSEKTKSGFPVYVQSTHKVDDIYMFKGFEKVDDEKSWLIVTDPRLSRDIKFSAQSLKIKSPNITNEINKRMTADSIYYVLGQGKNESDYSVVKIESIDYTIDVFNARCSGNIVVKAPGKIISFKNGKLDIYNRRIISKQEYNEFFEKINKDKNFLSLAVIKEHIPDGHGYYFYSDTMALYKIERKKQYDWDDEENNVYYCYAYGQSYSFTKHSYDEDFIQLLTPEDSIYLLGQRANGENYRLENAKKWDEKNAWLVERDEKWDNDTCVLAKILWDFGYNGFRLIDSDGEYKSDWQVDIPKKGAMVPVIRYGADGDYTSQFRFYYKGEYFCVSPEGLEFKNVEHKKYLMRRGQQGYRDRLIKALAHSIVESIFEESEMYENYNKKQIFYLGNEIYDSGYGWDGVKIKFYNCYKKTIKYIYCTLTAYNYFGDVQAGYSGRSTADIRCIGPLEHGEGATFSFDDIMNNKNEIIKSYRPTKITITFVDNSTISFNGWAKIKPHSDY